MSNTLCKSCKFRDSTGLGYCKTHLKSNLHSESVQSRMFLLTPLNVKPIDIRTYKVKHSSGLKNVSVDPDRQFYISSNGILYELCDNIYLVGILYNVVDPFTIHKLHNITVSAVLKVYTHVIYDKLILDTIV